MNSAAIKNIFETSMQVELQPENALRPLNIRELLSMQIPPREFLLSPWLPSQGLAMIYAPRGIGKTMVALGLSYAVATGGKFLGWQATKPRRVVYLDGEMPLIAMQERMARIVQTSDTQPDADFFQLVSPDMQERGFNLATEEGRKRLEPLLESTELVVVDNISTLASFGRENESESWLPLQEWALDLRRRGISVLFIHHAGKGGGQRGTSRREDVLDTVIALRRPKDYDPRNGAQFEVHFEKARGLMGEDAAPFCAQLTEDGWTMQKLDAVREGQILALKAEGLSQREIAVELGTSAATVNRTLKARKKRGQHDPCG